MNYPKKVKILGTEYKIEKHRYDDDAEMDGLCGYCRYLIPEIVICDLTTHPSIGKDTKKEAIEAIEKETLRHEIIHAFLNESGIGENSFASTDIPWSRNEEMIDWIALQFHKIEAVYDELGI